MAHDGGRCTNRVLVPREALEERVRRVLDVLAKDPAQLDALVKQHNDHVAGANKAQLAAVERLRETARTRQAERDNLIAAIKHGKGIAARLTKEAER